MADLAVRERSGRANTPDPDFDWRRIAWLTHVSRAMTKLGARDRAQLVVMAYQSGLVRVTQQE